MQPVHQPSSSEEMIGRSAWPALVAALIATVLLAGSTTVDGGDRGDLNNSASWRSVAVDTVDDPRPPLDPGSLAQAIHRRVNDARNRHGLGELAWVDTLRRLGRVHSRDMARRGFFGHVNPDGEGVNDRAARLGYTCYRYLNDTTIAKGFGENLYRASRYVEYQERYRNGTLVERVYDWKSFDRMAGEVVEGWLNSPPHRRNLLDSTYDSESIGVYVDDNDYYVTQIFC